MLKQRLLWLIGDIKQSLRKTRFVAWQDIPKPVAKWLIEFTKVSENSYKTRALVDFLCDTPQKKRDAIIRLGGVPK